MPPYLSIFLATLAKIFLLYYPFSCNCMFELIEIAQNGDFYDRIFPIVLTDAKIYNPKDRLK
ncbi:MAG: hypothetical protein ACKPGT_08005 [Microcystis sp.]|uniref:hypothetical protein n=1 Tax=unclassified Microcystis TaxID=2643300 RepID=UPI001DD9234B|nr:MULTISPECIES: hypothetical protein [unclassified Microcystis]MBE5228104.1 hypothetical protein [Microcystis aeruginosa PMC 728.11]MCA2541578.1 hypothetical protein [Microcystis sp. M54BS1]MCA2598270.1 hypothetical protein [Microcystis sp. M38BS1]MCA2608858.1 hypothetical protein [Microcystis sp. M27BS1]MCA2506613.1 hypothetical protein [Microcystis sp. M62BS1]